MSENSDLTVVSISNNWPLQKPRRPLVQLLHSGPFGQSASFAFHPKDAGKIVAAIRLAARSAKDGRKRQAIKIDLGKDDQP